MTAPSPTNFDRLLPVLSFKHGLGIRRYYAAEIKQSPEGPHFVQKVAVFDLENFQDCHIIDTREFEAKHLGYGDSADNPVAEGLLKGMEDKENFKEQITEFTNDLNTIRFCENEDAFWVCWRGAVLRKIALDGSRRSSLIALESIRNYQDMDPLMRKYQHAHIHPASTDDRIVFGRETLWLFDANTHDISDENAVVLIPEVAYESEQAEMTEEQEQEQADIGINVIPMGDLESNESFSGALDQLVAMLDDVDTIKSGKEIVFLFRDPGGNELDEESFFKKAITLEKGPQRIETIIRKLMAYDGYEYLYHDPEMTAMSYAVRELVLKDEQYIDLYVKYIRELDFEHDCYHQEVLICDVIEKHGWTLKTLSLLAIAEIWSQESWFGSYGVFAENQALFEFLKNEENLRHLVSQLKHFSDGDWDKTVDRWAGDDEEALRMLQRAAREGMGGNWKLAADILTKAARRAPNNKDVLNLYGYALVATGDGKAEVVLNKVLELDSRCMEAHASLALWHFTQGEIEKGKAACTRVFEAEPDIRQVYQAYLTDILPRDDSPWRNEEDRKAAEAFLQPRPGNSILISRQMQPPSLLLPTIRRHNQCRQCRQTC